MLKKLTGADSISGDVKFGNYLQFTNSAKFLYGSNHVVLLPNKDAAFYDGSLSSHVCKVGPAGCA